MATKDMHYSCQSPICVLQYCDIDGYIYANGMTAPHATPRSTLPPAHHHHQDIAALQDRLTRLSQASLNINESLDLDDVFRQVLDSARSSPGSVSRQVAASDVKPSAAFPVREANLLAVPRTAPVRRNRRLQHHRRHRNVSPLPTLT